MKRVTAVVVAGALIAAWASVQPHGLVRAAAEARPRLVLFLSVDQMRYDYLTRFGPLFEGGLRRLMHEGAVFTNARFRHANCETGPGHSVLLSGQSPQRTGIVANGWYDSLLRRWVNVVEDPVSSPVGGPGRGASPAQFVGFTVGDQLKRTSPASRVVGVSMKDRAAVLMAGPRADAAYWYESNGANFITSTYYAKELPAWLAAWNARRAVDSLAGRSWTRLLPDEAAYRKYAGEDDVKGEWNGKDIVFPHRIAGAAGSNELHDAIRRTPFSDELLVDVALEALRAHDLGTDDATDILAVGLSATDSIGHTWGPDSHEIMDQMLRLDRLLARVFAAVEARVPPGRTMVVLASDHGVMPLVEVLQKRGVPARRASPAVLEDAVAGGLRKAFPSASGLIAVHAGNDVWLDLQAVQRARLRRSEVEAVVERALLSTGLVDRTYTHARLAGDPPADDPYFALVRGSFFESRSPHVLAVLKPYVYLSAYGGGTGHGTPHDYDRHVPVVFLGPGVRPGSYGDAASPEDIAPTLAKLLGLDYPVQEGSRRLTEMLTD